MPQLYHLLATFRWIVVAAALQEALPLAPEAACVGLEIRVVGNDSGEKVFIWTGNHF